METDLETPLTQWTKTFPFWVDTASIRKMQS